MFVRHEIKYYALCLFLIVLSFYYHPVFFILLLLYFFFVIQKIPYYKLIAFIMIILLVFFIHSKKETVFPSVIEGTVIECKENSAMIKCKDQNVKVYHHLSLKYGDRVKMKIKALSMNQAKNDHGFDEVLYYRSHDIQWKASLEELISIEHEYCFVDFIEDRLSHNEKVRSYQRLFILGIKDEYVEDDYQQLLNLSVVHLFALSGMHLHYLRKLLGQMFSFFFPKKYVDIGMYLFLFYYLSHIPFSVSLYRAFYMMLLYDILKNYLNKLDVFSIVFIFFLLKNPYYIYHYSFIFSFGIYFLVLITTDLKYQELYVYILSLPFIICMQNRIYFISFIFSMFLGIFVEVFYQLIVLSIPFPIFTICLDIMVMLLDKMIHFALSIDYQVIIATPPISFIILFYSISFILVMKSQLHLKTTFQKCLIISLLLAVFVHGRFPIYAQVTMIDVGQGDCTLIRLPFSQGTILIDTGGNKDYDLATSTLIPYFHSIGLSSIDYVYISHDDFDHCGALESLQKNFDIKHVIRSYEKKRVIGDLVIEMLTTDKRYDNTNDRSLIMKLSLYEYQFLFMGDASIEVEKDLLDKYQHLDIDVLKVSHHGSQTSSGVDLFELIQPKVAMIGVKKNNIYKHPSNKVIERLKKKGIKILRTDEDGMFHLRIYQKNAYIFR